MSRDNDIHKIRPGYGRIAVQNEFSRGHVFSELSSTYPLKLLSPRTAQDRLAIVYLLSYGGGLVGGDSISLSVDVGPRSSLVLLSQGSTKIFKERQAFRASAPSLISSSLSNATIDDRKTTSISDDDVPIPYQPITTQKLDVHISSGATLFLLPDPVTCFKSASYNQLQTFHLDHNASVLILDSLTSGRRSLGEEWAFKRYYSMNEVRLREGRGWEGEEETCVAKDTLLLEHQLPTAHYPLPPRSLADKLAPYSCYATAILYGPAMQATLTAVADEYEKISVFKQRLPPDLIWSFSHIKEDKGGIVRVAGIDTEGIRNWFRDTFRTLEDVIGIDTYRKAFP